MSGPEAKGLRDAWCGELRPEEEAQLAVRGTPRTQQIGYVVRENENGTGLDDLPCVGLELGAHRRGEVDLFAPSLRV